MYHHPSVIALRESLEAIAKGPETFRLTDGERDVLRDRVFAVVDNCKAIGWPPERCLIVTKTIAREAGLRQTRSLLSKTAPMEHVDALLMAVIRWSIERYFSGRLEN